MSHATDIDSENRRQEPRYRGRCRRVIWRKTGGEPTPGVLCDFSASGASFMVMEHGSQELSAGEQIVLKHAAPSAETQVYEVRRVEHMGFGYSLAGCCRAFEVEILNDGVRLPRLSTNVKGSQAHKFQAPHSATKGNTSADHATVITPLLGVHPPHQASPDHPA